METDILSLHYTLLSPDTYLYIMGGVLLLLTILGTVAFVRTRRRWLRWTVVASLLLGWYVFLYGTFVGIYKLEVKHVELAFSDLPPAFDGYRIVQFSDVHAGTLTGRRASILQTAVDSINAQKADMVVFTGDLQNKRPDEIEPQAKVLSGIKAKDGVFSVLGNHDYPIYTDDDPFDKRAVMGVRVGLDEELGWTLLCNQRTRIKRGDERIVIAGLDNDGEGRFPQLGNIQSALYGVKRSDFVVMLEHDPSAWKRKILPHSHTQLTLSGHTHGGQVAFFGWAPVSLVYKETAGLYTMGERCLYVTKGVAGVVPFRFGATPEIVVITLKRK